jgi:hypothetical protein
MSYKQTIFRLDGTNRAYTKISNSLLQDSRISHEAKGLICELLSRPMDWEITVRGIVASGQSGRDKVYRMIKEAEKFGYVRPDRNRRDDGTYEKNCYIVSDCVWPEGAEDYPLPENQEVANHPLPGKPYPAKPYPANPPQQRKESNKEKKEQTEEASLRSASCASAAAKKPFPIFQDVEEKVGVELVAEFSEISTPETGGLLEVVRGTSLLVPLSRKRQGDLLTDAPKTPVPNRRGISAADRDAAYAMLDEALKACNGNPVQRHPGRHHLIDQMIIGLGGIEQVGILASKLKEAKFLRGKTWLTSKKLLADVETQIGIMEDRYTELFEAEPSMSPAERRRKEREAQLYASVDVGLSEEDLKRGPIERTIDAAIAIGADERITKKLGPVLLTLQAGKDATGKEPDYLLGVGETLLDLGEIPDEVLDWAAKDIRRSLQWRPAIAMINKGISRRLQQIAKWREEFQLTEEELAALPEAEEAWQVAKSKAEYNTEDSKLMWARRWANDSLWGDEKMQLIGRSIMKKYQKQTSLEEWLSAENSSTRTGMRKKYWEEDEIIKQKTY